MPIWQSIFLQNSSSPSMESLNFFHDHCMGILILILMISGGMAFFPLKTNNFSRFFEENEEMEIFWSTLPSIILIIIAIPSLKILYLLEETPNSNVTLKIIGSQWYWSYQMNESTKFDSFLEKGDFRLLSTSNFLSLPFKENIRVLISSTDVIHSWTLPSLGVKADAVPGRMNQLFFLSQNCGALFGQCSEICGAKHSFMPISTFFCPMTSFENQIL
uniref:Cytochrome c oxidase subunit 2 n=1 Tax=Leptotrombidium akamushi TaxID=299468 RepID=Q3C2J1_9ACAR|nr:cytochrome c oxidase subunit II [Leptotrombidium akamushi]BAE47106.1 cytochrome oxidase subunit 2 [Leptotrombidium akamushi]